MSTRERLEPCTGEWSDPGRCSELLPDEPGLWCIGCRYTPLREQLQATAAEANRLRAIVMEVAGDHRAGCECDACEYYHEWRGDIWEEGRITP